MTTATRVLEATIENIRLGDIVLVKGNNHRLWNVTALTSDPVTVYNVRVLCHRFNDGKIVAETFTLDQLVNDSARIRAQEAASVLED
jgi:hypothetical protein